MKAYKGFEKNKDGSISCRDFIFEEGKTYEHEGEVSLCESGFHACEAPLDCLNYYNITNSEFHEVELSGVSKEKSNDTKRVAKKIKIGKKLNIAGICKAQISYVKNETKNPTSGYGANAATSGNRANAATSGDWANAATSGDWANAATSGYGATCVSTGKGSSCSGVSSNLCAAWGKDCRAKGEIDTYLVLSEWGDWDGSKYPLICARMVRVDGKRYKPDTWYTLKDGKVVMADETD